MKYKTITGSLIVMPEDGEIFSDMATTISIEDEAGGPFVIVSQTADYIKPGEIRIGPDEWDDIKYAIYRMMEVCNEIDKPVHEKP